MLLNEKQPYHTNKKPLGGGLIKEEDCTSMRLSQEICGKCCNPVENRETGTSLQDK